MGDKINYIALSLTQDHLKGVIEKISDLESPEREDLLNGISKSSYGESVKDWQPFGNKKIQDILEEGSPSKDGVRFVNQFEILEGDLDQVYDDFLDSNIHVVFIDLFTLFVESYQELIRDISNKTATGKECVCCFIVPNFYCDELYDFCSKRWRSVLKFYRKGAEHRFIYHLDDLLNFRYVGKAFVSPERMHGGNSDKVGGGDKPTFK